MEVGLGPGDIVLDGDPAPTTERGTAPPIFQAMSIMAKRSPISATAENILPSLIKFRQSPKLAITISDSFVVSVLTLIPTQLAPLPPPSFTPNSITVILSTTTYLSLRSPASKRSRTLLPVLLLKLLNAVTSLVSYTLFTGSE